MSAYTSADSYSKQQNQQAQQSLYRSNCNNKMPQKKIHSATLLVKSLKRKKALQLININKAKKNITLKVSHLKCDTVKNATAPIAIRRGFVQNETNSNK